ncbi:hypothetical protein [Streptomyces sp. NPDC058457]|uniref:hypothetical protein n=1 Tax=Streptomyces sp. NPDC058457 TaxID=3346507 RepID=UPI00364C6ACB
MGCVGKTQLAADYARTAWQAGELDVLVWITASNATQAASGYAQAGIEILGAEPGQAAQAFLAWLEPGPRDRSWRWLVVLDDVADPADLNGLWPPASPHGRTLVTTRRKDAVLTNEGRRLIEVGLFTEAESVAYLTAALAARDHTEPAGHLAALAGPTARRFEIHGEHAEGDMPPAAWHARVLREKGFGEARAVWCSPSDTLLLALR